MTKVRALPVCFFKALANCAGKKAKLLFAQDTANLSVSLPSDIDLSAEMKNNSLNRLDPEMET